MPITTDNQLPQQETTTVAKHSMKGAKKMAFATPDVIGNRGINTMVFTLEDGIGSEEYRKSVLQLKSGLIKLPDELKQKRLKSLQDARIRLSEALNVSEALGVLKKVIIEKMNEKITERRKKSDGIILESLLETEKSHTSDPDFYLDLMGCNWIRYMKTIRDDILK